MEPGKNKDFEENHGARLSIRQDAQKLKFKVRIRNRCRLCGRPRGYLRKFKCADLFRGHALRGKFPAW